MKVPLCFTNVLSVGRFQCMSFLVDTPTLSTTNQVYLFLFISFFFISLIDNKHKSSIVGQYNESNRRLEAGDSISHPFHTTRPDTLLHTASSTYLLTDEHRQH